MKTIRISIVTALVGLLLLVGGAVASAHNTTGISGTVDCQGNYSITVRGDIWGGVHLIVTLRGDTIYDQAQGGDDHSIRDFGPFTGSGAAPGDAITAKTGDSSHVETGSLVLTGGPCEHPYTPTHHASFQCGEIEQPTTSAVSAPGGTLTLDLTGYKPGSTVSVVVDGFTKYTKTFGGDIHKVWHGFNRYRAHRASIVVHSASPTGNWTRTLKAPACLTRPVPPRGSINGPCEDPMYRATVHAGDSDATGQLKYKAFSDHQWHTATIKVKASHTGRTRYVHVLEFTKITLRINGVVYTTKTAAAGGWYGKCPA